MVTKVGLNTVVNDGNEVDVAGPIRIREYVEPSRGELRTMPDENKKRFEAMKKEMEKPPAQTKPAATTPSLPTPPPPLSRITQEGTNRVAQGAQGQTHRTDRGAGKE